MGTFTLGEGERKSDIINKLALHNFNEAFTLESKQTNIKEACRFGFSFGMM